MKIRETARKFGKGVLWAVFPVQAWRNLVSTKDSIKRIAHMARRGRTLRPEDMNEAQLKKHEVEQIGREMVLDLEEHERFEFMAEQLKFSDADIEQKMRAMVKAHAIRLCLLIFTVIITIGLTFKFGLRPFVYGSAATLYLTASCIKTVCLYTQLQERALWNLRQLIARPGMWIWRRAFWFLD